MQVELTKSEISLIVQALNAHWLSAHYAIERKQLGDIERQNYIYQRDKSKELLTKLDDL